MASSRRHARGSGRQHATLGRERRVDREHGGQLLVLDRGGADRAARDLGRRRRHREEHLAVELCDVRREHGIAGMRRPDVVHARNVRRGDDRDHPVAAPDRIEVESAHACVCAIGEADSRGEGSGGLRHIVDETGGADDVLDGAVVSDSDAHRGTDRRRCRYAHPRLAVGRPDVSIPEPCGNPRTRRRRCPAVPRTRRGMIASSSASAAARIVWPSRAPDHHALHRRHAVHGRRRRRWRAGRPGRCRPRPTTTRPAIPSRCHSRFACRPCGRQLGTVARARDAHRGDQLARLERRPVVAEEEPVQGQLAATRPQSQDERGAQHEEHGRQITHRRSRRQVARDRRDRPDLFGPETVDDLRQVGLGAVADSTDVGERHGRPAPRVSRRRSRPATRAVCSMV